jgi:hypothetical protein
MQKKHSLIYQLLIFSLIWIIIDGVFRKWILPEFSSAIFAIKYILFSLIFLLHLVNTNFRVPKINYFYQLAIVLLAIWCFTFLFHSAFPTSILVKLFGLINYIFFIPLLLIVPYYFNSISKIEGMIKFLGYLSVPIFIIGIIQYFLPVDHILNYLPNEEQKFNKVAEFTRSNSIFSFVKMYNVYLLFVLTTFTVYIFYLINKGKSSWFYIGLLAFGVLSLFMTGSRLPLAITTIFTLIIFVFIFLQITTLRKSILVTSILGIVISFLTYNFSTTMQTAVDAFFKRAELVETIAGKGYEGYSVKDRTIDRLTIFKYAEEAGYTGFGIGTTYQGTGLVLSNYRSDIEFEEEGERIVLEIGVIGGILIILLRLTLLLYSLNVLLKMKNIQFALLILPFVLYLIPPLLFLNNNTFNYFDGFSYWFSFSLVIALSKIYHQQSKHELPKQ